jgi:hypothetical protein
MVECLRPGGWLVDEDGDWGTVTPVDQSHPFSARYQSAYRNGEWWAARGYDPNFGRKLPLLFERCGLENIRHEATAEVVRGGSPWARWWQQTLEAIRDWEKAEHGLTKSREEEYTAVSRPWMDPSFWFQNALVHALPGPNTTLSAAASFEACSFLFGAVSRQPRELILLLQALNP